MTLILNRRKQRPRRDQTGTFTLRRRLQAELRKRFLEFRRRLVKLVDEDDAFGLRPAGNAVAEFWLLNCGGPGSGVPGPCPAGPAGGLLKRIGAKMDALASKVPGVKQVKDGVKAVMGKIHRKLAARYGEKAATVIMASGSAGGYGVAAASFALTGIPGIPVVNDIVSIAAHTAVAEAALQFSRARRWLTGNELSERDLEAIHKWIAEQINQELRRLAVEHSASISIRLQTHPDLLRAAQELIRQPVANVGQYSFPSDVEKLRAFRLWVQRQMKEVLTSRNEEELWRRYTEEGMKKGAGASFEHVRGNDKIKDELEGKAADFYGATKLEFLRSAFAQPVAVDKVKLLASRSFEDLEGVTEQMGRAMSRTLTQGLVQGDSPREVARQLVVPVDSYANRAMAIARTEIIRAHAEGQLVALKQLGVKQLGVQVEWSTSGLGVTALGNLSPCPICADHAGEVYDVDEAQGLIPFHPS